MNWEDRNWKKEEYSNKIIDINRGKSNGQRRIPLKSSAYCEYDTMTGSEFEYYCAELLKNNGFSFVHVTKSTGDGGVDITANKDNVSYAIQCKRSERKIGNKAVQEVYTGRSIYNKAKAVVMTNNYYTKSAITTANQLGVILWDRDDLNSMAGGQNIEQLVKRAQYNKSWNNNIDSRYLLCILLLIGLALSSGECSRHANFKAYPDENIPIFVQETEQMPESIEESIDTAIKNSQSEYILPDSDIILLTDEDVEGLSTEELQLAINEIYAKRGRIFTGENGEYFRSKSWYKPQYTKEEFAAYEEQIFNDVEKENIRFLVNKQSR